MSRWANYGRLDTPLVNDGDALFTGVNMKLDRSILGPGMLAASINKRLAKGSADDRSGTQMPDSFNSPAYGTTFAGSGLYSNPNGNETLLIGESNANFVWALGDGLTPVQIPLPSPHILNADVLRFVQAFDKLVLLRSGLNGLHVPLAWDGIDPTGFKTVVWSGGGGTAIIPNAVTGEPFQDRILFPLPVAPYIKTTQFVMTLVLDYTAYNTASGVWNINTGANDGIVRILGYLGNAVLVLMDHSIHLLENFTGNQALVQADQRIINRELGCAAEKCVVQIGADVIFLSEPGGFYRVGQVIQLQIQTQPKPISDSIQPIIDRINWNASAMSHCSAVVLGIYAYFTVPIDGANRPNCILVLNTTNDQWESVPDQWARAAGFFIDDLRVTFYQGARRIFAIDYVARKIYLLYEGITDQLATGTFPVSSLIETRGYGNGSGADPATFTSFKNFKRAYAALRTYNPSVKITAISDGPYEEKLLTPTPITKDRTKYYPWGTRDYVESSDDPAQPKRQDYSPSDGTFAAQDFENFDPGPIVQQVGGRSVSYLPGTFEAAPGVKQQAIERMPLRQTGRWVSLRIENNQGQCDVMAAGVDAMETARVTRVAA